MWFMVFITEAAQLAGLNHSHTQSKAEHSREGSTN